MKKIFIMSSVVALIGMTSCAKIYPGMVTTASSIKTGVAIKKYGLVLQKM